MWNGLQLRAIVNGKLTLHYPLLPSVNGAFRWLFLELCIEFTVTVCLEGVRPINVYLAMPEVEPSQCICGWGKPDVLIRPFIVPGPTAFHKTLTKLPKVKEVLQQECGRNRIQLKIQTWLDLWHASLYISLTINKHLLGICYVPNREFWTRALNG